MKANKNITATAPKASWLLPEPVRLEILAYDQPDTPAANISDISQSAI
jgi:hypothetical protein